MVRSCFKLSRGTTVFRLLPLIPFQDISFSDIDYLVRESTEYVTIDVVTSQPFSDVSTVTVRTRNITAFGECNYSHTKGGNTHYYQI